MSLRERIPSGASVVLLGLILLAVPVFDISADVVEQKSLVSTLVENAAFLLLTVTLVGLGLWLVRNDWDDRYVRQATRWGLVGTVGIGITFAWVFAIQLFVQNDLKPYVIAADGVVIGSVAALAAGIYDARSSMESDTLASERNRFSALFDNTSDCLAAFEVRDGRLTVSEVNRTYRERFGGENGVITGDVDAGTFRLSANESDEDVRHNFEQFREHGKFQTSVHRETLDGTGDFVVSVIPTPDGSTATSDTDRTDIPNELPGGGFIVYTDITDQRDRERQLETLSEANADLVSAGESREVFAAACEVATTLFDDSVASVWQTDGEAALELAVDTERAPTLALGDGETLRRVLGTSGSAAETPAESALRAALADGERPSADAATTFVGRVSPSVLFCVVRPPQAFSTFERFLLDVLTTSVESAVDRLTWEQQLERRNDQLEFLNSLLRHDIQNSMTVIRARGDHLAAELEGRNAEFAATIVDQSDDVIDLVDRFRVMLDALSGEAGTRLEPVSMRPLLCERVDQLRSAYPDATVETSLPEEALAVTADGTLQNVVDNLLTNAVEHNDTDDPHVEVRATADEETVTVEVADDGPGVPDEQKDVVFRRGESGMAEEELGSGFGLFFVDTMARRYGGSVDVRDNDPRGAVFEVTLPRTEADA